MQYYNNPPLISVVVCTFNGEKYIEDQLQSIIQQTYSNIEIIVVDDGSHDNTVEIVNKIASSYPNIQLFNFKKNLGYIKNFERGIELSKGQYIALSDQDDWWHPEKIEISFNNLKEHDIIYCDSIFTNENLTPTGESFSSIKNLINSNNPLNFLIDNCVSGHAMLFKRDLFDEAKPFPENIPHDWWLTFCASLKNGIVYIDKPLVKYRFHQNNVIAKNKTKKTKSKKTLERKNRLQEFSNKAVKLRHDKKNIITEINNSYRKPSFFKSVKRMNLFFKYKNEILVILKKSLLKKQIFCFNMLFKLK